MKDKLEYSKHGHKLNLSIAFLNGIHLKSFDCVHDLETFFTTWQADVPYIMEEFILGEIETFDGIADQDGRVVFYSTFHYSEAVLDTVEKNSEMFYFIPREIPQDIIHSVECIDDALCILVQG